MNNGLTPEIIIFDELSKEDYEKSASYLREHFGLPDLVPPSGKTLRQAIIDEFLGDVEPMIDNEIDYKYIKNENELWGD